MTHPGPLVRRTRTERGTSLSAFVAVIVVALLGMGGLVIDGGAQSAATRECQQVAAQAARAASDAGALRRAGGVTQDASAVRAAAQAVVAAHPGMSSTITLSGGAVRVRTTKTIPTTFLSLVRIDSLPASGDATATLVGG